MPRAGKVGLGSALTAGPEGPERLVLSILPGVCTASPDGLAASALRAAEARQPLPAQAEAQHLGLNEQEAPEARTQRQAPPAR